MNPWIIGAPAVVAAAAGLTAYGAAHPRAQLFGSTICRTNSPRKLALTFDDGPNPAITPKLLDLLDRYNAKATFFLIGRYVRESPELARETAARGHLIGNHTETHPNLFKLSQKNIRVELRLCHDAIASALQRPPQWFRPPYGFRNPWVVPAARELGYQTVMWTLIPGDWKERPVEWLIARMQPIADRAQRHSNGEQQIPRYARNDSGIGRHGAEGEIPLAGSGSGTEIAGWKPALRNAPGGQGSDGARGTGDVLCLHDGAHREENADRSRTLAALEHWLPRWRDLGLEFVTMGEAVSTPAA